MEAKVRFNNKISEPLMNATNFRIIKREKKGKTIHSLEFTVCYSMGVNMDYSFDSYDEKIVKDLYDKIAERGEFLFDRACKACEETVSCTEMDYDLYLEMSQAATEGGELKFAGKDYVVTV